MNSTLGKFTRPRPVGALLRQRLFTAMDAARRHPAVWISGPQFEVWKHTQLVIDVVPGRGGGFSLEAPEGMRFLSRGRAFVGTMTGVVAVTGA